MIDNRKPWVDFIDREWLDANCADEIISETQKIIKKQKQLKCTHANQNSIRIILNEIIYFSICAQIPTLKSMREWHELSKLASYLLEYAERIENFRGHGIAHRRIPEYLIQDATYLINEVHEAFQERPNKLPWERFFYPRIIGAYSAVFQVEPVSTAGNNYDQILGPTATFIQMTIMSVHRSQAQLRFDERCGEAGKPKITWQVPSADKLRVAINEWMKLMPRDKFGQLIRSGPPMWEGYADQYKRRLQAPE